MDKEEIKEWLKFCKVGGIGSSKVLKLLSIFGDFKKLYSASDETLYRTRIFNEEMIQEFRKIQREEFYSDNYNIEICEKEKIMIIPIYSPLYPQNLKNLPDAPLTIYTQGNLNLIKTKKIAIVGSRKSDKNSLKWAYNLSKNLVKEGITIVSGGAKGIDYESHLATLENSGNTICILGSGLLRLYPPEHREMFQKIKKNNGLLISEHSPTDKGGKLSLLRRNRIISGISDGIIIVTSGKAGGSRTQIEIANKQRIPSFVPNKKLNLFPNEGINEAIIQHKISGITDYKEVLSSVYKRESIQKTL
jgi:DNA processing protein